MQGHFEDNGWQVSKDGTRFWAHSVITALREPGGALRSFLNVTRDLSEMRRQEEALRQSEERYRSLVQSTSDFGIFTLDPDGKVTSWSASARRFAGYESGEVIGSHISIFYPPEAVERGLPQQELAAARDQGRAESEGWRVRKDGSRLWISSITTPLRDSDGKLRGFARMTRDLTERRRREEALRENEERFRSLLEGTSDYAIFTLDPDGHITSWNAGAHQLLGYEASEIIGSHLSRLYPPEAVEHGLPQHELALAESQGRCADEGWRLRKDGSRVWLHSTTTALRDPAGTLRGFARVSRDRTEKRQYEEALRQSEAQLRSLIDGVREYAIVTLDADGHVTSWNLGARLIVGYEPDEVIGSHFSRFYPLEAAERGWPQRELAVARALGRIEDEGWRVRKDGSHFWASTVITAMRHSSGSVIGYSGITRDQTERHRREEALIEAQDGLRQHSRVLGDSLHIMKDFVAELSHELRGPLAPIRNAAFAMAKQDLTPAVEGLRQTIDRQSGILSHILDELFDVNRVEHGRFSIERRPLQLAEVLSSAIEACRPLIDAHGVGLHTEWPSEPIWLLGDVARLTRVFINLLNNAANYTTDGGQISVLAETTSTHVKVRVKDTGAGIAPESLERIFEPYRSGLNEGRRGEGLGLGLFLVRRIVELHDGTVEVRSEGVGAGSDFIVTLPLNMETQRPEAEVRANWPRSVRAVRVLCVDDNPEVAAGLAGLLEAMGHKAQTACDAATALSAARAFRPEIVLLDIDTPGIGGYELAGKLLEQQDEVRPILVALTGWGHESDRQHAKDAGFQRYLLKPVTRDSVEGVLASLTAMSTSDSSPT
jgi:PAS domain S-box-containing protein